MSAIALARASSPARAAVLVSALLPALALRIAHAPRFALVLAVALSGWMLLEWIGNRLRAVPAVSARADLGGIAIPAVLLLCVGDIGWAWLAAALCVAALLRHGLGGVGVAPFHPALGAVVLLLAAGGSTAVPALPWMPAACALALAWIAWRGGGVAWAPLALLGVGIAVVAPGQGVGWLAACTLPAVAAFVASDPAQAGTGRRVPLLVGAGAGALGGLAVVGGVADPWPAALLAAQAALPWLERRDALRRARLVAAP